jgi:GGDEF domain-containing protein
MVGTTAFGNWNVSDRFTASIGVALFNQQDATPGGIMRRADKAIYQAKHAGGNQVRLCA